MSDFEDYSEEISQRKEALSDECLSCCVTADTLVYDGLTLFYDELTETCLGRDWRKLAGKLLTPPPTRATIKKLSKCENPARELLQTWVSQSDVPETFDSLIETMVECKLYSACDELLDFLQNSPLDLLERCEKLGISNEVEDRSDGTLEFKENPTSRHMSEQNSPSDLQQCHEKLDRIDVDEVEDQSETSKSQQNPTSPHITKQQQEAQKSPLRSISCPARVGVFTKIYKALKKPFKRSKSCSPKLSGSDPDPPTHMPPTEPDPPSPPEDEIFIVSSDSDNQTQAMINLKSFVSDLKPVKKGELKVTSIHDIDQNGQVTTAWLEERVNRARYVILCFSSDMKAITECPPNMPQLKHQMDYNLKFTMDFLVTGTIYGNGCRNPKGKFIPVLLHGHDMTTLILPLRHFLHFSWPSEEKRITKYIMNLPEHPMPCQGLPKRLVPKELSC
ncbi:---NA--- [Paramuricea clavata]|uniref:---NA n=1 Tax=Paramuricea clavata TaxID=317549 RepID=A0A7D9JWB0_PARCT|nr:---NA--- [Paramuricea clavata]